jgi:hypothetical protein
VFRYRYSVQGDAAGAAPYGRLEQITDYYNRLTPGRMVITGEPGSGKTALALSLALGLLENRRSQGAPGPVPVLLSLTGWDPDESLESWLIRQLERDCGQTPIMATKLVEGRRILPILDGLDEMDFDNIPFDQRRAVAALKQIEAYHDGSGYAPLVLICRDALYESFHQRNLRLSHSVRIVTMRVSPAQGARYLQVRSTNPSRWDAVVQTMTTQPWGPLAAALNSPWRLNLAATMYEFQAPNLTYGRNPQHLCTLPTADAIGRHLLDGYVGAATRAEPRGGRRRTYLEPQVTTWLGTLASYLDHNGASPTVVSGRLLPSSDLLPHELWAVAGVRRVRALVVAFVVLTGVVGAGVPAFLLPDEPTNRQWVFIGGAATLTLLMGVLSWRRVWPAPVRADARRLATPGGLTRAGIALGIGGLGGYALGLPGGAHSAIVMAAGVGLLVSLLTLESGHHPANSPLSVLNNDLLFTTVNACLLAVVFGLLWWPTFHDARSTAAGAVFGLCIAFVDRSTATRYAAFLLCTRGRLPWRVGAFLRWARDAGILRTAGIAYRFRHTQVRDHLA